MPMDLTNSPQLWSAGEVAISQSDCAVNSIIQRVAWCLDGYRARAIFNDYIRCFMGCSIERQSIRSAGLPHMA